MKSQRKGWKAYSSKCIHLLYQLKILFNQSPYSFPCSPEIYFEQQPDGLLKSEVRQCHSCSKTEVLTMSYQLCLVYALSPSPTAPLTELQLCQVCCWLCPNMRSSAHSLFFSFRVLPQDHFIWAFCDYLILKNILSLEHQNAHSLNTENFICVFDCGVPSTHINVQRRHSMHLSMYTWTD